MKRYLKAAWSMNTTPLVVFVVIIALGIYDLGCVVFSGVGSSISAFMVSLGFKAPFTSFVFGCIAGHFFFYMQEE